MEKNIEMSIPTFDMSRMVFSLPQVANQIVEWISFGGGLELGQKVNLIRVEIIIKRKVKLFVANEKK